jgi:hypothetical protein
VLRYMGSFNRLQSPRMPAVPTGVVGLLSNSLRDESTLELGNRGEHRQKEPSRRVLFFVVSTDPNVETDAKRAV